MDLPTIDLHSPLQEHFRYPAFRPGQEPALRHVLAAHDTLVVMPTGSGKSLIYQLAAMLLPGTALVFSPLIALMKDQVDSMRKRGIPATYINSSLDPAEADRRVRGLVAGEYKLVLVAPERLRSGHFRGALMNAGLNLLVLDEAHCLSQWGHDFRPDYLHIARLREEMIERQQRGITTLALTATATPRTQESILELLDMPAAERVITGFNRPNLFFEVRQAPSKRDKLSQIRELINASGIGKQAGATAGAAIIYTGTRADAEDIAAFLRETVGLKAEYYHGALQSRTRDNVQDQFMSGDLPIVVATNAFGMGIDRPDVRLVLHHSMPGSLEAYYQEAGRAGRDGLPARATLLYSAADVGLQEYLIESNTPTSDELHRAARLMQAETIGSAEIAQRLDISEIKARVLTELLLSIGGADTADARAIGSLARQVERRREHKRALLRIMAQYAQTEDCRRRLVLDYFGDASPADAPVCCDVCEGRALAVESSGPARPASTQAERGALIVLDTVASFAERDFGVGRAKLAQILKGSASQDVLRFAKHRNYAKFAALKITEIESLITQLLMGGYLKQAGADRPVLALSAKGDTALQARAAIDVSLKPVAPERIEQRQRERTLGSTIDATLALLNEGKSIEQVAAERALTVNTIYTHCAQLIEKRQLGLDDVLLPERAKRIRAAIAQIGSSALLAPIKTILPADYDYGEIRCVAAALTAEA